MSLLTALLLLLAGLAVGATSIGGIVVVPVLTELARVPLQEAIAASSFGFLFTGAAAVFLQGIAARNSGSESQSSFGGLYGAALAGAALGALTLTWLPPVLARSIIAALAVLSGVVALSRTEPARISGAMQYPQRTSTLITLGVVVGCASAWSGTGGPVLLLPILMLARMPTVPAIEMAQGIQLPIAAAATAVNILNGTLNFQLGLQLGLLLLSGWAVGRILSRRLSVIVLRQLIAWGITAVGLWYGWQSF